MFHFEFNGFAGGFALVVAHFKNHLHRAHGAQAVGKVEFRFPGKIARRVEIHAVLLALRDGIRETRTGAPGGFERESQLLAFFQCVPVGIGRKKKPDAGIGCLILGGSGKGEGQDE